MGNYMWREVLAPELCFTANTAGSTVKLTQVWTPTSVNLETSTDGESWSTYTIWSTITLSNIWDKVFWRNSSTTTTGFSTSWTNYYQFAMTGSIEANWDVNYLLNKNGTDTLSVRCFNRLFASCSSLTSTPQLPATTLPERCYSQMFTSCTWLTSTPTLPALSLWSFCYYAMFEYCTWIETLPKLDATTLAQSCYRTMFSWCSKIKLSTTQTWEYQTAYRIPTTWTWTVWTDSLLDMFRNTWWTLTWTPTINTTYYTSNTVI